MNLSIFSLVIVTIIKSVRFNMQKVNKYIEYNVETTLLNESWSISVSDMCEYVVRHLKYSDIVFFFIRWKVISVGWTLSIFSSDVK